MRSNELIPSVTLENLPISGEEKMRLAEIKLECESLWQKVEGLPEGLLNKQDKTYLGFLRGRVLEGIEILSLGKTPIQTHDRINEIHRSFDIFKRDYEKIMASFSGGLPVLTDVLADGQTSEGVVREGREYPAAERDVSKVALQKAIDDVQMTTTSAEETPPTVPKTIDELLLAAGFRDDSGEVVLEDPVQKSISEDDISMSGDEPAQNQEYGRKVVSGYSNTNKVNSLADLASLTGIKDVVKSGDRALAGATKTNQDIHLNTEKQVLGDDEQWEDLANAPDTVSDLDGYAGPMTVRNMLPAGRFSQNASVSEAPSSEILQEQPLPHYQPGELAADLEFYRAWQSGNADQVFSRRASVLRWELKKIKQDIDISLRAAGYTEDEIKDFFTKVVQPWSAEVVESREKLHRERKTKIDHARLKNDIVRAVSAMLAGREPNEDVFIKNYEAKDEGAEESEVVSSEAAAGETGAETIPSIEEETEIFIKAKGELVNRGLHIKFHYALADVERHLAAVARITADGEMPLAKKVERISQHKAALQRLLNEIIIEAFAADTVSTPVVDHAPTSPTPDAVTPPVTAKDEAVAALHEKDSVTPTERGKALSELDSNPDLADMWRQSRREFGALKLERHEARAAYYEREARSVMGKVRSVAKLFGFKTQLPKELQAIEEKYEAARKNHAAIMSQMDRVKEKFDLSTAAGKRAFARHFVLNPHVRQQQLQAQVLEMVDKDAKYTATVKNVLAGLRRYKWHTRVGTIVAVAALGAATGGVAAGGFAALTAAGRMAASTGAGTLAAFVTREGMQARVEKKEEERDAARQTAEEEFSLDALEELEAKFVSADTAVTLTKKRKDAATVAAALAGGFSAGAGVTALAAAEAAPTVLSEVVPYKSFDLLDKVPVKIYSLTDETSLLVSDIDFIAAKEGALEVSEITRQLLEKETTLAINDILSVHKNMPAAQVETIVLERLQNKFGHEGWWQRAEVKAISIGSITEAAADTAPASSGAASTETAISSGADNLDYGALNGDDGGVVNNPGAGSGAATPDNLDYGAINGESGGIIAGDAADTGKTGSDNLNNDALNEATATPPASLYEVKSGDTLWKIMENKYADSILKNLSETERNRVLDALFDKARADATLRESIGLNPRAGGSIDKLWPGDTLNTAGLEAELKKIVAGTEALPARPRTGTLPVEAAQGEQTVPITNRTNTPLVYPSIQKDAPVIPAYADLGYINPVRTGAPFVGAGSVRFDELLIPELPTLSAAIPNYLETTEYKNIVEGLFGGQAEFNRAVGAQVQALEAGTYDFMNRLLQDFKSPYSTKLRFEYGGPQTDVTLSKMTLAEIQQLRTEYKDPFAMREFAQMNGFKYETLDAWFKKIDDLKTSSHLPYSDKTTLADLFGRSVAKETLERQFNAAYEAKQLAKK